MSLAIAILAFVTAERLIELEVSRRNTKRLMEEGGVEHAPGHYPFIVVLHAAWLGGLWLFAWDSAVNWLWIGGFVVLQILRIWVLLTLGRRWTTRIIVMPGAPLVEKGPYRFVAHPNYLVVIGEIAVLPLVFGMVWYAVVFSVLNAAALYVRIRAENDALGQARARRAL